MSDSPRPEIVVFDLGGVLIRICRSWSEACVAAELPVRGESASMTASGRRHELSERHGTGTIKSDEFFALASRAMDGLYSAEEVRRVHDAWLLGEYAGVGALTADIRRAGLVTGVLSNTNHAHWVRMLSRERGGTGEFGAGWAIDHPHASHLLGLLKPDAAIYRAFERVSGFEGRAILFFDDLAENVDAARACGWQAEVVDHTGDTAGQMRGQLARRGVEMDCPPP